MTAWSPVDLLPGLYVGLVAVAFAALLRRWLDPLPWRVLALFLLVLVPLFGDVLFRGKVLLPLDNLRGQAPFEALSKTDPSGNALQGDLIQLVHPSQLAVREAFAEGRWPLWNPRVGLGMPLLADPQTQALQPLVHLASPFPPARATGVIAGLRVFFALAFFFLFLRRQGLGEGPAVGGAFAYGLGGFVLLWVGWPLANSAVWLPALLWAVGRCDEEGGRRDTLLLAATLVGLLLAGHPETILYSLVVAKLFFLSRLRRRPKELRSSYLRRAALAGVLALGVSAPLLLPAGDLLPRSLRSARLQATETLAQGPNFSTGLARRLLPIVAPDAYGNDRFAAYWGLSNVNEDAGGFAGTATLLALLAGIAVFWPGAKGSRFPQERTAWLALGVCLVLLAQPFALARLLQAVPMGAALASRRLLLPLLACIAFLGAAGLERFRRGEGRWPALAVAGAVLAGLVVWGTWAHGDPAQPGNLDVLRYGLLRWQLRMLAVTFLVLLAAIRLRPLRLWAPWAVALCVATELIVAHRPANPPMPAELYFPQTGALRVLRYQLGTRQREGFRMAAQARALPPNLASIYGLSDLRIYNPMAPQAEIDLLAPLIGGWWGELPQLGAFGHPLYSRLGVRYLLARPSRRAPPGYLAVYQGEDGWVWENPKARAALSLSPDEPPESRMKILRLEAQRATARADLARPAEVGTTLFQDGGWRALADRRPVQSGLERGALLTVSLPAGRHRLDLLYRPASFAWGCALAALALACAGATLIPPPSRPG